LSNYAVNTTATLTGIDKDSSYDLRLTITDAYGSSTCKSINVPTEFTLVDYHTSGKGISFGKVAESENILDSALAIREQGTMLYNKYAKRVVLSGQIQKTDYAHSVIALCKVTTSGASGTYSSGTITFHRVNGLQGLCVVDVAMEDAYSSSALVNVNLSQRGFNEVTPCTFTYNGVTYGGLKVYLADACLSYVDFVGTSNFDIFGLDYYHSNNGVLNSEVYNSLQTITVNGSAGRGSQYFYHNINMPNSTMIYAKNTNGVWGEAFCPCAGSNNITMGYASYINKLGEGKVFGNRIVLISNTDVRLGSTSGTVVTSDRNLKNDIKDVDDDKYTTFYNALRPVTYKYAVGNSGRPHIGFIAQEVEEALKLSGMNTGDFAGICISDVVHDEEHNDPDMDYAYNKGLKQIYSLRYEEFIGLNTYMIQKLNDKVQEQQVEIDCLKKEIDELKTLVNKVIS
jgi:hypothetical protein